MRRILYRIAGHARAWQLIAKLAALLACLAITSCTTYSEVETRQTGAPSFETFGMVSQSLEMHCGSLDCHGTQRRNYRLYGWSGIRLEPAPEDSATPPDPLPPGTVEQPELAPGIGQTTEEELWLNYTATVLLEPEATSVVLWEGRGAEELLLVSKGTGREHHKGLVAMEPGGPTDRCVSSWLIGAVDELACADSFELGRIPPDFAEF